MKIVIGEHCAFRDPKGLREDQRGINISFAVAVESIYAVCRELFDQPPYTEMLETLEIEPREGPFGHTGAFSFDVPGEEGFCRVYAYRQGGKWFVRASRLVRPPAARPEQGPLSRGKLPGKIIRLVREMDECARMLPAAKD